MAYKKRHTHPRNDNHTWRRDSSRGSGNYYYEHVVLPGTRRLLKLRAPANLLDLGCGAGALGRSLRDDIRYLGIDESVSHVEAAKRQDQNTTHTYSVLDTSRPLPLEPNFTHCAIVLALQHMKHIEPVIQNAATLLMDRGILVIVLNHPCFRIPRQSSWGMDEKSNMQYRRINRYLSPLEIPTNKYPGKHTSSMTWSYHHPLKTYAKTLKENGFLIDTIEEWSSDKGGKDKDAKLEQKSRNEIPLFLAIKAVKLTY